MLGQRKADNLAKEVWAEERIKLMRVQSAQRADAMGELHVVHTYRMKQYDKDINPQPFTAQARELIIKKALKKGFYPVVDSEAKDVFSDNDSNSMFKKLGPDEWYLMLFDIGMFERIAKVFHRAWTKKLNTDDYLQEHEKTLLEANWYGRTLENIIAFQNTNKGKLNVDFIFANSAFNLDAVCQMVSKSIKVFRKDEDSIYEFSKLNQESCEKDFSAFFHVTRPRAKYIK